MSNDVIMWLIVLFGGLFLLVGTIKSLFMFSLYVDEFMSKLNTAPWFDNLVIKACLFVPLAVYCYFWYTVSMSLAEQL